MALLKNRLQIVHYGICKKSNDVCEDIEIEKFLNSNKELRKYITKIYKFSSEGSEPVTYPVQTEIKYKNLRSLFNLKENELLDDKIPRAIKFFNCGQQYIFECRNEIDLVADGIEIIGFANTIHPEIPIEKTGLVTHDCCITEDQYPTPLIDRIQFAWYGICSSCSNVRIEEVLNQKPEFRENISIIYKYTSEGSEPTFYRVQTKDKYNNLRSLYNLKEDEYLDDRIGTLGFKNFECGDAYIFACKNKIELTEKGILLNNFTVNTPSARISNCITQNTINLKLVGGCDDDWIKIVKPNTEIDKKTEFRNIAILITTRTPTETNNWKDISFYDYIHYATINIGDENNENKPPFTSNTPTLTSTIISANTPTLTKTPIREDETNQNTPTETINTPTFPKTPTNTLTSYFDLEIPFLKICDDMVGCIPTQKEVELCNEEDQTPTPSVIDNVHQNAPSIVWGSENKFRVNNLTNHSIVIIDTTCSPCQGSFGSYEDIWDGCTTPTPTISFNEPPPPTLTETNTTNPPTPTDTNTTTNPPTLTNTISPTETPPPTPTPTPTICPWFDCEGVCEGDAKTDCLGVCNGDAELDCLGVCNGVAKIDCAGVCNGNSVVDCEGVCNGDANFDCANICNGKTEFDCLGECGGDAKIDVCGECGGNETDPDNCDCIKDCAGVCNGDAKLDCAGVCNGDAKLDCAGVCNGNSQLDCAGVCNGDAKLDCAGVCNGDAKVDCEGVCNGDAKPDCAGVCNGDAKLDCAGDCNGDAKLDCAGVCNGDARRDCAGVCNGDAKIDCLGVCNGNAVVDCAGVCNGDAKFDCEGVCEGDAKLDCAGICRGDTKFDCRGICDGDAKIDVCGECDGKETNPDNCDCVRDCAGICNGDAKLDCLGICNGNAKKDCNGVCGGTDFFDCEGVCGGNAKLDCEGICNGDAKLDCEGVCNGDAKLDCEGVCNGPAKEDCKGKCNGNAKLDCKNICGGDAKLDCKGDCDGNAIKDCLGICGGTAIIDCEGVCNGDSVRDCEGVCNGNARRDCANICNGNCRRDICGVCCGNAQNPDDCCVNCEESFGQMEFFNHGFGWRGTGSEELRMRVRERSAPVWEVADETYRIYGDLDVPVRQPLPIFDLGRYRKDENNNPRRGPITLTTSLEGDTCDSMGGRGSDSTHIRFLDNDAVKIDNESSLITIQTGITSDNVERVQGTLTWKHTFTIRENDIDIRNGDSVYIRSVRGSFHDTYERAPITAEGGGSWSIISKKYSENRPFSSNKNQTVIFVLNRIAVPVAGGGDANYCDRNESLLAGESDVFRYKVGEGIECTNRVGRVLGFTITDIDEQKGTLTLDGDLRGHIQWWSFDSEDGGRGGIARTSIEQQNPTVFDEFPSVRNTTTPCMIRLESRTNIPGTWRESGAGGTLLVFDGRLNGKTWDIHRINSINRRLFYVKSESIDRAETMLCNECSCAFRIRNTGAGDPPDFGPRSVCAVTGAGIRNHAVKQFEFEGINPVLENDKLAVKAREGGRNYVPYMTGYMAMGNPRNPNLIDLVKSKRFDYIEFKTGDFEV